MSQHLRVQPGEYVIEHFPEGEEPAPGAKGAKGAAEEANWLTMVRAPEGPTVVRRATPADVRDGEPERSRWVAFYSGQSAHGLDVPGMLAAVVNPLAESGLPVFVASTYHADLILVPAEHLPEAVAAWRRSGHEVSTTAAA